MATVEDVCRGLTASMSSDISWQLCVQWVNTRYKQLARRVRLRHLRVVDTLYIPGYISAGVASATEGSIYVTGDATAQAAWTTAIRGRHIRFNESGDWYEIKDFDADTKRITIASPFSLSSGTTATSVGYKIVQRYVPLPPQTRHFKSFVYANRRLPIRLIPEEELDIYAPGRTTTGQYPRVCAEVGSGLTPDGKKCRLVEFFPYDKSSCSIKYLRWPDAPDMDIEEELPVSIDEDVLREGALIDLMRYKMAQYAEAGNIEAAALMRNEYRAQETRWDRIIQEAVREDKGDNDTEMLLEEPSVRLYNQNITNAHDQVLANWPH